MKKRIVFAVLAAALLLSLFSGCKGKSGAKVSASYDAGELYYWSCFTGDSQKWDAKRVEWFKELYPNIKIDFQSVPESAGIRNGKLLAAIASGNPPDVIVADDYISAFGFVGQDAFLPWDPYMEAVGLSTSDFMPGFRNVMEYKGKTYLLPQDSNVIMLYINTEMADEAGLDYVNGYPKNIDELMAWAEKMTKRDASGRVTRYGYIPWLDSMDDPTFWPFMYGADLYLPDTNKLDLTDARVVASLNWQREFAKTYDPAEVKSFTQSAGGLFSPDHPFFSQKVAMTVVGNWATEALRVYAPTIKYACVPIPVPPGGRERSTPLGSNVFAIPKGAKHPELAATFFKFTQKAEINADNFDQWRSIPTVDAVFDEVSWTKAGDPIYLLERQLAKSPKSSHPALCAVSAQLRQELITVRDDVIYNQKDPVPLLLEVQNKLQPELDKKK